MLYDEEGRAYIEHPIIPEEQHLMYIVKDYRRMYNMHKKMQAYIQKSDEVIKRSASRNYALIRINREQRNVIERCFKWMKKKGIPLSSYLDKYAKENRM